MIAQARLPISCYQEYARSRTGDELSRLWLELMQELPEREGQMYESSVVQEGNWIILRVKPNEAHAQN